MLNIKLLSIIMVVKSCSSNDETKSRIEAGHTWYVEHHLRQGTSFMNESNATPESEYLHRIRQKPCLFSLGGSKRRMTP
jgi:hypothetical protein